jgi:histidinol-phosphate aminotransferase
MYGPPPGVAKLNANENPYGPSPAAIKAMAEASQAGAYYVRESSQKLRDMIAEHHGLTREHVMLSSGSSGVLTFMAMAASKQGSILAPDLFWDTTAKMGVRNSDNGIVRLPKRADLAIDLAAMEKALTNDISLVHVTNPNNPTGSTLESAALKDFCIKASAKTLVLVDEAYNELTDNPDQSTMIPLVKEGRDVAVARTFSKIFGLAGMRVGYLIAKPELLEMIGQFGLGDYGLNQPGVAGAIASYQDEAFLAYSKAKIVEGREMVAAAIKENGLYALPSQTNFMFVDLGKLNAEKFRVAMAERNVLIRGIYRDYTNWSRVSMGKLEDVEMYAKAMPYALDAIS